MSRPPDHAGSILIVDDDEIIRVIMRAELEDDGFHVREAADGLEALERCAEEQPDLLVVDAMMPRMDGYDLCRELRRQSARAFLPILMATGLDDVASVSRAYEAGATDFIPKPLQWVILKQRIRYMLRSAHVFDELRRNQQQLIVAKEAAEAASRAKTEFLSVMSHELRTPLNAVIGLSTMMSEQTFGPLSGHYLQYATAIRGSGEHLLVMINDILDLARAEAGELALNPRDLSIADVVQRAETVIRPRAEEAGIAYGAEVEPDLPLVRGDPEQLERVLVHLLGNAVKFTKPGGAARLLVDREAGGGLRVQVQDTGIGIPLDKIQAVLAPFGQADSRSARGYEGAGLGLPLSRRLIELHGGTLALSSEAGQGATVCARFPPSMFAANDGEPARRMRLAR